MMKSTLAEFDQHAVKYDILDECRSICIPVGFISSDSQLGPRAVVIPPSFYSGAISIGIIIVVLIRCAELHPIGDMR